MPRAEACELWNAERMHHTAERLTRLKGQTGAMWMWLKINQEGLRRFWSMFPLTRVPFWYRFFEPQPCVRIVDIADFLQAFFRREGTTMKGSIPALRPSGALPSRRAVEDQHPFGWDVGCGLLLLTFGFQAF